MCILDGVVATKGDVSSIAFATFIYTTVSAAKGETPNQKLRMVGECGPTIRANNWDGRVEYGSDDALVYLSIKTQGWHIVVVVVVMVVVVVVVVVSHVADLQFEP